MNEDIKRSFCIIIRNGNIKNEVKVNIVETGNLIMNIDVFINSIMISSTDVSMLEIGRDYSPVYILRNPINNKIYYYVFGKYNVKTHKHKQMVFIWSDNTIEENLNPNIIDKVILYKMSKTITFVDLQMKGFEIYLVFFIFSIVYLIISLIVLIIDTIRRIRRIEKSYER